jgi:hypothetical protein
MATDQAAKRQKDCYNKTFLNLPNPTMEISLDGQKVDTRPLFQNDITS